MVRPRFDPAAEYVATKPFIWKGAEHEKGTPFVKSEAATRQIEMLYDARKLEMVVADREPVRYVLRSNRYWVTAPWLPEEEKFTAKSKAEARVAELREAGPPLGWIEGGSVVTVEGGTGGWYDVNAPWLDEPERVQGRETAEARQRELHDAGEPDDHHGFTLTAGENGWYEITGAEMQESLKVHGEEAARDAVAKLRSGETVPGDPIVPPETATE